MGDKRNCVDKILVSACLAGFNSRYDGGNKASTKIIKLIENGQAIPFCPEQAGGLSTPRPPSEIIDGDGYDVIFGRAHLINKLGEDVTQNFINGAKEALKLARMAGIKKAILKAKSPSCGVGSIYDGTFSGNITKGDGVTTALLKLFGIQVLTEEELIDD